MKYKFLPHTSDVKFQAYGKSLEQAFSNSAYALKEVIAGKIKIKAEITKKIIVKGKDNESLLYNFLEEFLFLLDSQDFIFGKVKEIKIDEKGKEKKLEAEIVGDKASKYKLSGSVKAVTYNQMYVKKNKNKYIVQVVLDV